jgi:predicted methyltransferase
MTLTSKLPDKLPTRTAREQGLALCFIALIVIFGGLGSRAILAQTPYTSTGDFSSILQSPLRLEKDLTQDSTRKPTELLKFAQVKPGWQVMDVYCGGGYTTQLMALAVSDSGKVYAQMDKPSKTLQDRLRLHQQSNIEFIQRPMDDLIPPDLPKLDLVTLVYSYHDISNMPIDRLEMDRKIYASLKTGGYFVIIDHSAEEGSGLRDTSTLHRIDKAQVIQDFTNVGFKLDQESAFLTNASDTRKEISTKMNQQADGFALRFKK